MHRLLLAGFVACVSCSLINMVMMLESEAASASKYSIFNETCMLSKQSWWHKSLPLERPPPGDKPSIWKTIEHDRGYASVAYLLSRRNADSIRSLEEVLSTAVQVAEEDVCTDGDALVGIIFVRTSKESDAYVVSTRVQCGDGRSADRTVAIQLSRGAACEISLFIPAPKGRVNIILAYSARQQILSDFLERARPLLANDANLKLLIGARGEDATFAEHLLSRMPLRDSAAVVPVGADIRGNFSKAVALRDTIRTVPPSDIVFVIDAEMRVDSGVFRTCRLSALPGAQVWFPVVFMGYPRATHVAPGDGFWARWGFGMTCLYRSDFDAVGGFGPGLETAYFGWGSEDRYLWLRFRDDRRYGVLRSYEPGLFHFWHRKKCEHNRAYKNCLKSARNEAGGRVPV